MRWFKGARYAGSMVAIVALTQFCLGNGFQPIELLMPSVVEAGATVLCNIVTDGPGTVHVRSLPEGAASFDGPVAAGITTIPISISPDASGVVEITATMDGSTRVVGTYTVAVD